MTAINDLANILSSLGFTFLRWADWFPGGHPDRASGSYPGWTKLTTQTFPSTRHWVHHSVTSATMPPVAAAREINRIGISRFGKMSYPFLIHSSGAIIQGCYPYIGAHTKGFNSTSLAGCNIGNYDTLVPPTRMVDANVALIQALTATDHYPSLAPPIYGHQQSPQAATACPGRYLMARLPYIRDHADDPLPAPDPGDDDLTPDESKKLGAVDLRTQALIAKTDQQQKDLDAINLRLIAQQQTLDKILDAVT